MSKLKDFLHAYKAEIIATYGWASDQQKLEKFMASVEQTLASSTHATWNWNSSTTARVYRSCGGTGIVSLKRLRELVKG